MGNVSQAGNQTVTETGQNASTAINKTGEAVQSTASELGQNASTAGQSILNQTEDVAKKIAGGDKWRNQRRNWSKVDTFRS
jgi:hypothetical protein